MAEVFRVNRVRGVFLYGIIYWKNGETALRRTTTKQVKYARKKYKKKY